MGADVLSSVSMSTGDDHGCWLLGWCRGCCGGGGGGGAGRGAGDLKKENTMFFAAMKGDEIMPVSVKCGVDDAGGGEVAAVAEDDDEGGETTSDWDNDDDDDNENDEDDSDGCGGDGCSSLFAFSNSSSKFMAWGLRKRCG